MFKKEKKKEKKTLRKDLFLYKGNFIPAYVLCSFPFLLWAVVNVVEKLIRQETEKGERKSWLWHLGNCVAFYFCHFQPRRCKSGVSSFIIFFCLFLKEMEFCHLFFVVCSLMFFHGHKKGY